MKIDKKLEEAIDLLADRFAGGHLLVSTFPVDFIIMVNNSLEIKDEASQLMAQFINDTFGTCPEDQFGDEFSEKICNLENCDVPRDSDGVNCWIQYFEKKAIKRIGFRNGTQIQSLVQK